MGFKSFILSLLILARMSQARGLEQSRRGNGWMFTSIDSPRAFLHTEHSMSWVEAEDFCQMIYGHLATDDSAEYLREYLKQKNISGAVWIGLHQSKPQTQFTWTNDFDWSEVSLAPGDGWGEYVEEYETSLCVSLDIDHGYRWDTRYCQGVMVTGSVCQIELPLWVKDGRCNPVFVSENVTFRYYPDKEVVYWTIDGVNEEKLCSIEDEHLKQGNNPLKEQDVNPFEGSGLQSLDSFYAREDSQPQHLGDLLKPEKEGGISISIKYEIRSSDRGHEPILIQDGKSENYYDQRMMESNPDILSNYIKVKEKEEIQFGSDNTSLIKTDTADDLIEQKMKSLSISEKIKEKKIMTRPSLNSTSLLSEESPLFDTSALEIGAGEGITATLLSGNVTQMSFLSTLAPDVEQNTTSVNHVTKEDDKDAAEKNPISHEQSKERLDSVLSKNVATSSLVNSPILHRQKRFSPQRNGGRAFLYKNRNRKTHPRSYQINSHITPIA